MSDESILFREVQHVTPTLRQHVNRSLWVWVGVSIFATVLASTSNDFWAGFPTVLACLSSLVWIWSAAVWNLTMTTEIYLNRIEIFGNRYYSTLYSRHRVYYTDDIIFYQRRTLVLGGGYEYWPNRFHGWGQFDIEGIHLVLRTGKKVFIKTRQPEKFIAALNEMKQQPPLPLFAAEYPQ